LTLIVQPPVCAPSLLLLETFNVPALTEIPPPKVFVPLSVSVPVPDLVKPLAALMFEPMLADRPALVVTVAPVRFRTPLDRVTVPSSNVIPPAVCVPLIVTL